MFSSLLNITRDTVLEIFGLLPFSKLFVFELIDMVIMSLAIGYIFSGFIKRPVPDNYDPLTSIKPRSNLWKDVKFAAIAAGPTVVLHELAHKFVAMAFGAQATLYAPYGFYLLVIILKAINFPLLFFVGGFVSHTALPPLQSALVSIAGPLTNFLIWGAIVIAIKRKMLKNKYLKYAFPMAKISLFLAIFNMIPLPGFDGFNFFMNIFKLFA